MQRRSGGRRTAGVLAAILLTSGVLAASPVQAANRRGGMGTGDTPAVQRAAAQPGPENQRRQLVEGLARLAGVTPRDLRAAATEHGGLRPALTALGVSDRALLAYLTASRRASLEPAVSEGRLSAVQADRLARQQSRRLLRRIESRAPATPAPVPPLAAP